jgi:hypothetical protein
MCSSGTLAYFRLTRLTAYQYNRKGDLVTSEEGQKLQKRVWEEIKDVLRKHVPNLDGYLEG